MWIIPPVHAVCTHMVWARENDIFNKGLLRDFFLFFNVQSTLDSYYRSQVEELPQALGGQCWDFCPMIHQKSLHHKIRLQRIYQCNCRTNQGHIKALTSRHKQRDNLLNQTCGWFFLILRCYEDNPVIWWKWQTAIINHRCRTQPFTLIKPKYSGDDLLFYILSRFWFSSMERALKNML